jgi:hypothetical protein
MEKIGKRRGLTISESGAQDGKMIHELASGEGLAGRQILTWNANNLPTGIYYCMLQTFQTISVIKLMLEK